MSDEKKSIKPFSNIFSKLKKIKHLDIILTVLFIAIILLIYFSTFSTTNQTKTQLQNQQSNEFYMEEENTQDELSLYAATIENKLQQIICQIKDAGKVKVAVGFAGEIKKEYAYTTKTEELKDGTKVETKSPVLITDNGQTLPLVLQTIMPSIDKIVVVASGAQNTNVKLEILRAVQTIYDISNIQIFAGI